MTLRSTDSTLDLTREASDYTRIARAIAYLDARQATQPSLDDVADHVGLSPFHVQRLFRRWAGVSPKRFLQALTAESAKRRLRTGASVLESAFASGLSGPGRLHDLLVAFEAMTPGEYKRLGEGLEIRYGFHETPFGEAIVATTVRGVCGLGFVGAHESDVSEDRDAALASLVARWPDASFRAAPDTTAPLIDRIFGLADGPADGPSDDPADRRVHLLVRGTNFQVQVWQALLAIPEGRSVTYGDLATAVGNPKASRAVGTAVGANPIGFLIPCHRVIRQTGALGGYRWGRSRKRVMQVWEAARETDIASVSP